MSYKDRKDNVKVMKERQLKLEELKEQAAAAHKFREQQELLRQERLFEIKSRNKDRRSQVEERRKLIELAQQERSEALNRKNLEREMRIDSRRKREKSSNTFAFGSSTPRLLDPKESAVYWGGRRATSTYNVSNANELSRRLSENSVGDLSRKRATSASGLNLKLGDEALSRSMNIPTAARRKTDLIPTLPRSELGLAGTRQSSPGFHSGNATPSSRPSSALSCTSSNAQVTRRVPTARRPRPRSCVVLSTSEKKISKEVMKSKDLESSAEKTNEKNMKIFPKELKNASVHGKSSAVRKPSAERPILKHRSKAAMEVKAESKTGTPAEGQKTPQHSMDKARKVVPPVIVKQSGRPDNKADQEATPVEVKQVKVENTEKEVKREPLNEGEGSVTHNNLEKSEVPEQAMLVADEMQTDVGIDEMQTDVGIDAKVQIKEEKLEIKEEPVESTWSSEMMGSEQAEPVGAEELAVKDETSNENDIPSKMLEDGLSVEDIEKEGQETGELKTEKPVTGYASEEEYRAALAEKRRQAREAKERELELEQLRKQEEEERERREEEEYLHLMAEQQRLEEERLQKAIQEAEIQRTEAAVQKEEEERLRLETEKIEEMKRLENEERLRKEEEERQVRKNRVAQIMARTRVSQGSLPSKDSASDTKQKDAEKLCDEVIAAVSNDIEESSAPQNNSTLVEEEFEEQNDGVTGTAVNTSANDSVSPMESCTEKVPPDSDDGPPSLLQSSISLKSVEESHQCPPEESALANKTSQLVDLIPMEQSSDESPSDAQPCSQGEALLIPSIVDTPEVAKVTEDTHTMDLLSSICEENSNDPLDRFSSGGINGNYIIGDSSSLQTKQVYEDSLNSNKVDDENSNLKYNENSGTNVTDLLV